MKNNLMKVVLALVMGVILAAGVLAVVSLRRHYLYLIPLLRLPLLLPFPFPL